MPGPTWSMSWGSGKPQFLSVDRSHHGHPGGGHGRRLHAEANTHQIVVVSRDDQARPVGRILDLDNVVGQGNANADIYLRQYDVVFVPRTTLGKGAIAGDQLWRMIPLSFSINGTYSLGGVKTD